MTDLRTPLAPLADFPQLERHIEGKRINYLDSSATSLKPRQVIDAITHFYTHSCSNVHRGDHTLSREASALLEDARSNVARFIGATSREIIFTQNTTESLNFVADGLGLTPTDNVVTSILDHHSNILPWMSRCEVRFLPEGPDGTVDFSALPKLVDRNTRLISVGHVSNVTGAINAVSEAVSFARERGILTAIDGAQSVPHLPTDVVELDCDFLAFSSHKMLGPSGVGVLYVRDEVADTFAPRKLGGGTPAEVTTQSYRLKERPYSFEAGTPCIEGIIGLGAAVDYLRDLGMARVAAHDAALARLMHDRFSEISSLRMLGPQDPNRKIAIAALVPNPGVSSAGSLGQMLSDSHKIMARSGKHCAHPYFASREILGSLRLSTYVYNSEQDVLMAAAALEQIVRKG
jgi:cysteine desulfurase/selenocysteine lyase